MCLSRIISSVYQLDPVRVISQNDAQVRLCLPIVFAVAAVFENLRFKVSCKEYAHVISCTGRSVDSSSWSVREVGIHRLRYVVKIPQLRCGAPDLFEGSI